MAFFTIALCLVLPSISSASEVEHGRAIYDSILAKYPGLTLYLESGLMGENARLIADVPRPKWNAMSAKERSALAAFVQSELATVRSSPSRYSLTPTTAPIWPTHRAAFERICDTCWEIHTGRYDRRTQSLADDWTVAMKGGASREPSRSGPMLHEANLKPLSSATATMGMKLYNAAGVHEATIIAVDLAADRITVRYVRNGTKEPKMLSAISVLVRQTVTPLSCFLRRRQRCALGPTTWYALRSCFSGNPEQREKACRLMPRKWLWTLPNR
jgi:hypothetical protein